MSSKIYNESERLAAVVNNLSASDGDGKMCHLRLSGEPLPSQSKIIEIVELCRSLLFPGFFGNSNVTKFNLKHNIGIQCERLKILLTNQISAGVILHSNCDASTCIDEIKGRAETIAIEFIETLPQLREILYTDTEATFNGDPAATSFEEVIYCYPAIRAICNYRIAHSLLKLGVPIIPRIISELAHSETGIDIHPGATIGRYFSIDHGTGVVIGATSIIGENVKIYQGVTLGAKSFVTDENNNPINIPRHPMIGDNVVIYSNASILGRINIGANSVVGGNVWVTEDLAEGSTLLQAKANNIIKSK
ncbi:MAG: serine acetyltransferase [Bacteroidales bacterium]